MIGNKHKWDFVSLDNIAVITAGGDKPDIFSKSKTTDTPIPVIANAVNNDGIIGYTNKSIIKKNSITISARGTIGYSSIRNYPYYPIVRLISIIPDENIVDINYLKYIFDILYEKGVGTSIPQLTIPMITNKQIPLPPLEEQKRIIKIIETKLTAVEKIKKANMEQLSVIKKLFNAYINSVCKNDNWGNVKLGDISKTITKGTTPTTVGFDFVNEGINFIKIETITENGKLIKDMFKYISIGCHEALKRSQLKRNDILFSIAGAIGRVAIVSDDILPANTNQALSIIRIPEGIANYKYIYYILQSVEVLKQFESLKRGNSQKNLSLEDVKNLNIPFPSILEQQYVVDLAETELNLIEKLQKIINEQFTYINALPSSILRKAFNGDY